MALRKNSGIHKYFRSLFAERSRTIFMTLYALMIILPVLILIFIGLEYVPPLLEPDQIEGLTTPFAYGLVSILLISFLGFFLISRMVTFLEETADMIRMRSARFTEAQDTLLADGKENEVVLLVRSFNRLFDRAMHNEAEYHRLRNILYNLIAVGMEFSSELDIDHLFSMIISRVTTVMSAERTSLYVIDWDRNELWTKVAEGVDQIRLPVGEGVSGRVAETGEMLNVEDAWTLPYFNRTFDERHRFRTRSMLCVPVKNMNGERIGVLQVINKQGKAAFDDEDEILVKALAAQIGIALENSLLLEEMQLSFENAVNTLSAVVDARHPLTAGHSQRVMDYSLLIAREMGLSEKEQEALKFAALLHDIGKIGIRDEVLLKNGVYTPAERNEMNSHATKTKIILEKFHFPRALLNIPEIACHHHEKVDGTGYPDGLAGDALPVGSKIMAVADVFDALTSRRDYPKYAKGTTLDSGPLPVAVTIDILRNDSGSHFDPGVVDAFLRCMPQALLLYRGTHFSEDYVDTALREPRRRPGKSREPGIVPVKTGNQ